MGGQAVKRKNWIDKKKKSFYDVITWLLNLLDYDGGQGMRIANNGHEKFIKTEKTQLLIFAAVAYGLAYVMGLLLWYAYGKEIDSSLIPLAQMFYPAAGVMLAYYATKRGDKLFPRRFYNTYLMATAVMVIAAVLSVLIPSDAWTMGASYICMLGSVVAWPMMLFEVGKESRRAYGLNKKNANSTIFCVVLCIVLYILRPVLISAMQGEILHSKDTVGNVLSFGNLLSLFLNFFVAFLPFFGEEYGWRYFLQPLLQKRFGLIGGVLLLGVLWGLWHLPLNFFYYNTPEYGLTSLAAQMITCVTLGIFMAYTYMKTENIWVPIIIHYLNNNLVSSASGGDLTNRTLDWTAVGLLLFVNGIVFGGFILSKYFRGEKAGQKSKE